MKTCDKCDGEIKNGSCPCGVWGVSRDFFEYSCFEESILMYNKISEHYGDSSSFTVDHYSGTCLVIFKGDYEMCTKVKAYIKSLEE